MCQKNLNGGCRDRETNYVSNVYYSANGFSSDTAYAYDNRGNISSVTEGGIVTSYSYDKLNRLKSERSSLTDILTTYDYDINGNITAINKFKNGTPVGSTSFAYGTSGINKGRLVEITRNASQKSTITYDNVGNPCNYKDNVLQWERGRLLAAYGDNKFSYNADGIRIKKKTAEGVLHTYFVEGTRIHCERFLNHTNWYYYDATGITGMEHDGVRYFFQKNVQGDVMRIFDSCGRLVARYAYDAWGNHIVYDANGNAETAYNFIGNINPFRYRGYYFDVETGLYYLNTRYYDPSICRFINADDISHIEPETIGGLNLYSYCGNNPVMAIDPNGTEWWNWVVSGLQIALGLALIATGIGVCFGTTLIFGGILGIITEAFGSQIGGGIGSIVNGSGAISTGLSLFSYGWAGAIAGGVMVLIGAGTMAFGANEIVSGITGTNYIQKWTGMSDSLYSGLYLGSNIASSLGTIAGRLGMQAASTFDGHITGNAKPYSRITEGYKTVQYNGRGKLYWSIHRTNHGKHWISNPHWHTGAGRDGNHFNTYIELILEFIFGEDKW